MEKTEKGKDGQLLAVGGHRSAISFEVGVAKRATVQN